MILVVFALISATVFIYMLMYYVHHDGGVHVMSEYFPIVYELLNQSNMHHMSRIKSQSNCFHTYCFAARYSLFELLPINMHHIKLSHHPFVTFAQFNTLREWLNINDDAMKVLQLFTASGGTLVP
jgi:hypothetical protein